jgi:hypothetical protein
VKNSGHREAVITFFYLEKVSNNEISCLWTGPQPKGWIIKGKGFLVKHRLLDAAAR